VSYCWGTGVDDEDCVYYDPDTAFDLNYASANMGTLVTLPQGTDMYDSYTCTVVCDTGGGFNQEMGACSPDEFIAAIFRRTCEDKSDW
jgi:hypothetical protein